MRGCHYGNCLTYLCMGWYILGECRALLGQAWVPKRVQSLCSSSLSSECLLSMISDLLYPGHSRISQMFIWGLEDGAFARQLQCHLLFTVPRTRDMLIWNRNNYCRAPLPVCLPSVYPMYPHVTRSSRPSPLDLYSASNRRLKVGVAWQQDNLYPANTERSIYTTSKHYR